MFIEFKELSYSVVEDVGTYNVTIVRQGEPGKEIEVSIVPNPDSTSFDSAECKTMAISLIVALQCLYMNYSSI